MSAPLQKLLESDGAVRVSLAELDSFVARHRAALLVVTGAAAQRAEGDDLAVVASELARGTAVAIGVADAAAEPGLNAKLKLEALPALVFAKNGRVVTVLARVQPWSAYARAAEVVFGGREVRP